MTNLPDGFVVVVKEECATCLAVVPVLQQLADTTELAVYTQDNPDFPVGLRPMHDGDLAVSWHHDIETVPTLMRVVDGVEVDRTVGLVRPSSIGRAQLDQSGQVVGVREVDPPQDEIGFEAFLRALLSMVGDEAVRAARFHGQGVACEEDVVARVQQPFPYFSVDRISGVAHRAPCLPVPPVAPPSPGCAGPSQIRQE